MCSLGICLWRPVRPYTSEAAVLPFSKAGEIHTHLAGELHTHLAGKRHTDIFTFSTKNIPCENFLLKNFSKIGKFFPKNMSNIYA